MALKEKLEKLSKKERKELLKELHEIEGIQEKDYEARILDLEKRLKSLYKSKSSFWDDFFESEEKEEEEGKKEAEDE